MSLKLRSIFGLYILFVYRWFYKCVLVNIVDINIICFVGSISSYPFFFSFDTI